MVIVVPTIMPQCLPTTMMRTKYSPFLRHRFWTPRRLPSIRISSNQRNFPRFNSEKILKSWKTLYHRGKESILSFLQLVESILKTRTASSKTLTSLFISIKISGLAIKMVLHPKCIKNWFRLWWMYILVSLIQIKKFRITLHFLTISLFKTPTIKNRALMQTTLQLVSVKTYKILSVIRGLITPNRI